MRFSVNSLNVPLKPSSWDELKGVKAGGKACRQLARAVASVDVERTGTLPRAERLAAGRTLSQIHELSDSGGFTLMHMSSRPEELYDAVPAVVKAFSVSLREVSALASSPLAPNERVDEGQSSQGSSFLGAGGASEAYAAARSGGRPARDTEPGAKPAVTAADSSHGHGSLEGWVPLLVDSSAAMVDALSAAASDSATVAMSNCALAIASALLHSDALPALSRLLSAEAQRGPARALLSPGQLATCLQLLDRLILAAAKAPTALLPSIPPASRASAPTAAGAGPSATPTSTASSSTRPPTSTSTASTSTSTRSPSSTTASPSQVPAANQCASFTPRTQCASSTPRTLGAAVLTAVAESGVVEAACWVVLGALGSGVHRQRQGATWPMGQYGGVYRGLYEVLQQVLGAAEKTKAAVDGERLPDGLMGRVLAGPCVQVRCASSGHVRPVLLHTSRGRAGCCSCRRTVSVRLRRKLLCTAMKATNPLVARTLPLLYVT